MIGFALENPVTLGYYGMGQMDIGIDSGGHILTLSGAARVQHDVLKGILTSRTNGYGTILPEMIGGKAGSGIEAVAALSVQQFVDDYRAAQSATLPDEEKINSIRSLIVDQNPDNPSEFLVSVTLNMADGQAISVESAVG